ncbi:unnamed protein product [Sphagnum tenellum]
MRHEDHLQKWRQEIEQDTKMAVFVPATDAIEWSLASSGTVVSFPEDVVDLPKSFNSGVCRSHTFPSFGFGELMQFHGQT